MIASVSVCFVAFLGLDRHGRHHRVGAVYTKSIMYTVNNLTP